MLKLIKRKNKQRLREYFGDDFLSPMWDAAKDGGLIVQPSAGFLSSKATNHGWHLLTREAFETWISTAWLPSEDSILAYELAYGPPKSYSQAALTGKVVSRELLRYHWEAIDESLALVRSYLLTRKMAKGMKSLRAIGLHVWRFPHPWNRATEPQLNEHVILLAAHAGPTTKGAKALHAHPIFTHLLAIRAAYHYGLVSRLVQSGYKIVQGAPGSLLWELAGFDSDALNTFTSRKEKMIAAAARIEGRYFSLGAEMQMAALESRKEWPKSDPSVSLTEARAEWTKRLRTPPNPIRISRQHATQIFAIDSIEPYFHAAAVQTQMSIAGRILADKLGSGVPLKDALDIINKAIARSLGTVEIIRRKYGTICHRKIFQAEERVLTTINKGRGSGHVWKAEFADRSPASNRSRRAVVTTICQPDQIRVVCTDGQHLPAVTFSAANAGESKEPPALILMDQWNPLLALQHLTQLESRECCLIVTKPPHANEFLELLLRVGQAPQAHSIARSRQLRLAKTLIDVVEANMDKMDDAAFEAVLTAPACTTVAVYAPRIGDKAFEDLAGKLKRWERTTPTGPGTPVKLANLSVTGSFSGETQLYFGKRHRSFPRGTTCILRMDDPDKMTWSLSGHVRRERITNDEFQELMQNELVIPFGWGETVLRKGEQLQVAIKCGKLLKGEIVRFGRISEGGGILLLDGRLLKGPFLPLTPSILMRHLPTRIKGVEHLVVLGSPKDDQEVLVRGFSAKRITFILDARNGGTSSGVTLPDNERSALAREYIAKFIAHRLSSNQQRSREKPDELEFYRGQLVWGHQLYGSRAIWRQLVGVKSTPAKPQCDSPYWLHMLHQQNLIIRRVLKPKLRTKSSKQRTVLKDQFKENHQK